MGKDMYLSPAIPIQNHTQLACNVCSSHSCKMLLRRGEGSLASRDALHETCSDCTQCRDRSIPNNLFKRVVSEWADKRKKYRSGVVLTGATFAETVAKPVAPPAITRAVERQIFGISVTSHTHLGNSSRLLVVLDTSFSLMGRDEDNQLLTVIMKVKRDIQGKRKRRETTND